MATKSKFDLFWLRFKHKMGWLSDEEYLDSLNTKRRTILDQLPEDARQDINSIERLSNRLLTTEALTDWNSYFKIGNELSNRFQELTRKYGPETLGKELTEKINWISGIDQLGYRPSAARIWGFMLSPFQAFTFFYENHWAVKSAIDCIVTEVTHDGFSLVHSKKVKPSRIREVKEIIDRLNLWDLRLDMLKDYLIYGNSLVLPHKNAFWNENDPARGNNVLELEKLVMDRCFPIWSKVTEDLIGWDYWIGWSQIPYLKDRLLHLRDKSIKNPDIGLPPLNCLLVDLESDIGASTLNNTAMYKAGMVGILISLNDPDAGPAQVGGTTYRKRLQQEIMASFSGVKAGNSILVSNYVRQVFKLNNLSEFDAAFLKFREKVALMVSTVLKVPPERINQNRSSSLQYAAAGLEDIVNSSFDRAIAAYMTIIDKFINDYILKKLCGIYDVEIQANGRYGSMNLNSARASKIASETWGLFDVNEHRTIFYGAPPCAFDDERGRELVDNSKGPNNLNRGPTRYSKPSSSSAGADNPNNYKQKSMYRTYKKHMAA